MTVQSGAVDAISYLALGKVFTSVMTGNLVLFGIAVGGGKFLGSLHTAVAFGAYSLGAFAGSRVVKKPAPKTKALWPREVTVALGYSALAQLGFVVVWLNLLPGRIDGAWDVVLIILYGIAMGMQSAAVALGLSVAGVSSTYVTGTLIGVIGSLASRRRRHAGWALRFGIVAAPLLGAGIGGLSLAQDRTVAPLVPLSIGLAVVVVARILFWNERYSNPGSHAPINVRGEG